MMRNKILFFINQEMKAFFYKDRFYVIKCCDIVQKNKVFVFISNPNILSPGNSGIRSLKIQF